MWENYETDNDDNENNGDNFYSDNEENLRRTGEIKRNWVMQKLFTSF